MAKKNHIWIYKKNNNCVAVKQRFNVTNEITLNLFNALIRSKICDMKLI